jgi:hypothetical protein
MAAIPRTDVDVASAQVVTNKDLTSTTNTFPTTLQRRMLVCTTAGGADQPENKANTWAKIATYSTGTTATADGSFIYSVTHRQGAPNPPESAIISVGYASGATGIAPTLNVKMLSHSAGVASPAWNNGLPLWIKEDSFKMISDGWGTPATLWIKKGQDYGQFAFYEIGRHAWAGMTVTYHDAAPWQSAVPTGTAVNIQTAGITSGVKFNAPAIQVAGVPVVTGTTATGGLPLSLWSGTKAQYDAIPAGSKSATTIYVVTAVTAVTGDITVDEGAETGDIAAEPPTAERAAPATKTTRKK